MFFSADERVRLVEVMRAPATSTEALLRSLGAAEKRFPYPVAARLQRPLIDPDEQAEEHVFGARGLALLVARQRFSRLRLVRLRGFAPMPADEYSRLFLDLPQVRYFPE
ncbi:MAG: hypothetical protein GEV03_22920 [Streptosporangiales bacterium]|nr:hypothetical protein [Streptosporangiales bacterium]